MAIAILDRINIQTVNKLAKDAGEAIMAVYGTHYPVMKKADHSPLTKADQKAHQVIEQGLRKINRGLGLDIPILSEEGEIPDYQKRRQWSLMWLIDPLDGTKEFIAGGQEFTVNIALIKAGSPVLGVVFAPAMDDIYYAKTRSKAYKNGVPLPLSPSKQRDCYKIVCSRSHLSEETKRWIDNHMTDKKKDIVPMGSSLKICLVAEGAADCYPRFSPTMEWDTAAAHAIVVAAGKCISRYPDETPLTYNKEDLTNDWFIVH